MWQFRVNDRLKYWRDFRNHISELNFISALKETEELWRTAPFVTYYLDPGDPNNWPDPWTLLAENYYCDVAKSLGIVYTIYLSGHRSQAEDLLLSIEYDQQEKYQYNLACFDSGKYILNYWPGEIVNKEQVQKQAMKVLYQYSSKDLALEKY